MANDLARKSRRADDEAVDSFFEVPAAVVCAFCGEGDCPGCMIADENASGVIAIVPWERPGTVWGRLWSTAQATTHGAETFFAALPDGEVSPAMRFAVLAELLAVASMAIVLVPIFAIALPGLAAHVVQNIPLRDTVVRWIAFGIPAFTLWMVAAHVTHGAALDLGARRQGAKGQGRRAIRFGLYACGWDLMGGPLGAVVTMLGKGKQTMRNVLETPRGVPGRAAQAMLQGIYGLGANETAGARRVGTFATVIITLGSGVLIVGLMIAAAILLRHR